MKRTALLLMLLAAYAAATARLAGVGAADRLDAVAPPSRFVEQALGERRFADALPVALELQHVYPDEPLPAYWLAAIFRGLDRPRDEIDAWDTFIRVSASPAQACPGLAQAYERTGNRKRAIEEYRLCAAADPREPDFLADLGAAWERQGQHGDALAAYGSAARLDPANPELARRIGELSRVVDTDQ